MRALALFLFWFGLVVAIIGGYNHLKITKRMKSSSDLQSQAKWEKSQREFYRKKRVARSNHSSTSVRSGGSAHLAKKAGYQLLVRNGGLAAILISFPLFLLTKTKPKTKTTEVAEASETDNDQDASDEQNHPNGLL